jgi:hypothetical protein
MYHCKTTSKLPRSSSNVAHIKSGRLACGGHFTRMLTRSTRTMSKSQEVFVILVKSGIKLTQSITLMTGELVLMLTELDVTRSAGGKCCSDHRGLDC